MVLDGSYEVDLMYEVVITAMSYGGSRGIGRRAMGLGLAQKGAWFPARAHKEIGEMGIWSIAWCVGVGGIRV